MSKLNNLINKLCPDGVEFKALEDVCKLVTGATPSKSNPDYWENGTISWMSSGEVNLKRIFSTETKITQAGYDNASTKLVPIHSVVIALAGQGKTRGKVAITEIELCTNQSLCSLICKDILNYKYLYYYLDSKYEELRIISNGDGNRGGLSVKLLTPYKIPVPPLEVQREIIRILDNYSEKNDELIKSLYKEIELRKKQYEYYRDKLLTFEELK
ncbi:MAG: restriction endonuclease subunit S [Ruminococcus sp.]|nr:restriction endonuclease subunit S [Ruminococcus sp.]